MPGDPTTVLHGIDQSVPTYDGLPAKGHHGSIAMQVDHLSTWLYDNDLDEWDPYEYVCFEWDFDNEGGAIGSITLTEAVPANTLIWDGVIHVVNPVLGAGGTFGITVETAHDLLANNTIAVNGTMGLHDIVPDGTAAQALRTTAARNVVFVVNAGPLTAGKLYGFFRCFRSYSLEESSSSSSASTSSSVSTVSFSSASSSSSSTAVSTSSTSSSSSSTSTWSSMSRSSSTSTARSSSSLSSESTGSSWSSSSSSSSSESSSSQSP